MPYCRKCGAEMEETDRYCKKCGFDNQAQTLIPSKLELDVGPRVGERMFPKVMKAWWFLAIVIVIVLIIVIFFFFQFWSSFTRFPAP